MYSVWALISRRIKQINANCRSLSLHNEVAFHRSRRCSSLDVGYTVKSGSLADGQFVSLSRTEYTSPTSLEIHSPPDDLIQFQSFSTDDEQIQSLVDSIVKNIREEEVDPEDIIVINPDPLKTRTAVSKARALLLKAGINSSLAGVTNSADIVFESNSVTFTGIFRARATKQRWCTLSMVKTATRHSSLATCP